MPMLKVTSVGALLVLLCSSAVGAATVPRDRDHDGLPDRWERRHGLSTLTRSAAGNPDRDGLSNALEYRLRTNPRRKDTDRDGLSDGAELRRYKTSPRRKDTDRDGLSDRLELRRYHTNPRRPDTDGDGYADGREVKAGSDPRRKGSVPQGLAPAVPASPVAPGGTGAPHGSSVTPIPTPPPTPERCDRTATPSTLKGEFSAAGAGQVVCLASGDYGAFTGATKPGVVFLRPQAGATPVMDVELEPAANIVLDGLQISGGWLKGATHDITIRHSTFTDHFVIDGLANANVLLDANRHVGIMTCADCDPAMIHLSYGSQTHSGVTIQNSLFADGNSDGIQTGVGVNIINNEFYNLHETGQDDPAHTDPIQLLWAKGAVVRGNYIHRTADGIVAYDGVESVLIEDNVIDLIDGPSPIPFGNGARWGIELYSDKNSIVRHNTLVYDTRCSYAPCGHIMIDHKSTDPAGTGTQVYDNLATKVVANNGSTFARRDHNMVRTSAAAGDFLGTPVFAGGSAPANWAGYRLAPGSAGAGRGSDGLDLGIR